MIQLFPFLNIRFASKGTAREKTVLLQLHKQLSKWENNCGLRGLNLWVFCMLIIKKLMLLLLLFIH